MTMVGIKRRDPEAARRKLGLEWVGRPVDLPELMRRSDFVMLCLPLTEESEGMIDAQAIAAMKESGFLINLSRGGIVDKGALMAALAAERIAGAGLDVFWEEPPDPDDPIFDYNVLATPHVGGATDISAEGILTAVVENIRRVERGETPLYLKRG
jgi:phosphoglycerate dehydrogenase-like enzyme